MLKLLRAKNSKSNGYYYLPEGKDKYVGLVEITDSGEVVIRIESSYDKELGAPYYGNKAKAALLRMLEAGKLEDEKFYAWG